MYIISPLTLLIVPIIGSLIILAYPYVTDKNNSIDMINTTPCKIFKLAVGDRSSNTNKNIVLKSQIVVQKNQQKDSILKKIAIVTALINFIISLIL